MLFRQPTSERPNRSSFHTRRQWNFFARASAISRFSGAAGLRATVHILVDIRNLPPLRFGILAELPHLKFTALVGGRYPDVSPYGHGRRAPSGGLGRGASMRRSPCRAPLKA